MSIVFKGVIIQVLNYKRCNRCGLIVKKDNSPELDYSKVAYLDKALSKNNFVSSLDLVS